MIDCKLDCKLLVTFKQLSLFAFYKYTVILKVFFFPKQEAQEIFT